MNGNCLVTKEITIKCLDEMLSKVKAVRMPLIEFVDMGDDEKSMKLMREEARITSGTILESLEVQLEGLLK